MRDQLRIAFSTPDVYPVI